MATQTVFKRYELKYILTRNQYLNLIQYMQDYMAIDEYGRHKISNIYFDTSDYRIIRHSIEKPKYKEKLRLRLYGEPKEDSTTFIELKKKYNGVVYKRRVPATQSKAVSYLCDGKSLGSDTQIVKEIDYFMHNYDLLPKVYLSYEREAFYSFFDENFRMTFDFNIKMRDKKVSLYSDENDKKVLSDDLVLLEVKTVNGLPFWFLEFLGENHIYKTSFSKYGTAYNKYILPKFMESLKRF